MRKNLRSRGRRRWGRSKERKGKDILRRRSENKIERILGSIGKRNKFRR